MKLRYYFFITIFIPLLAYAMEQEVIFTFKKPTYFTQKKDMQQVKEEATNLIKNLQELYKNEATRKLQELRDIFESNFSNPPTRILADSYPRLSAQTTKLINDIDHILSQPISDNDKKIFISLKSGLIRHLKELEGVCATQD